MKDGLDTVLVSIQVLDDIRTTVDFHTAAMFLVFVFVLLL